MMDARGWLIVAFGAAAVVEDLRSRTISNWICGGALASGVAVHGFAGGWSGVGAALLGALIGFGVFLVFYLLGGLGGGDLKLMAGFGALLGSAQVVHAAFLTALCGGLMAAIYLAGRAVRRRFGNTTAAAAIPAAGNQGAPPKRLGDTIPYAPAIALGAWLTLITEL